LSYHGFKLGLQDQILCISQFSLCERAAFLDFPFAGYYSVFRCCAELRQGTGNCTSTCYQMNTVRNAHEKLL